MTEKTPNVVVDTKETLLAMARGAVGSNMFRHLYADVDGTHTDIVDDGDLSCAFFISWLLHGVGLIERPRATVSGLVADLEQSGWRKADVVTPGAVIVWEEQAQSDDDEHEHVGIALNEQTAISNSYKEKTPVEHHITFGKHADGAPKRRITAIYQHDQFI